MNAFWFAVAVVAVAAAILAWVLMAVKGSADEYLHSTAYEVEKMLSGLERDYADLSSELRNLLKEITVRLDRYDRSVERLVGIMWPDLTERERSILSLYLQGYNKGEIAGKLGLPLELVEAVVALRVGDGDA